MCSTSHHIGLHHCFAILPSPGLQLQMANFHSDAIVSVLELIHVQESLLLACSSMPWCMMSPLKYFSHKCVALLTTLGYTVVNRNKGISVLARPLSTALKTHSYVELRRNSVIAPMSSHPHHGIRFCPMPRAPVDIPKLSAGADTFHGSGSRPGWLGLA